MIVDIWMWTPFVMLLIPPGLRPFPIICTKRQPLTGPVPVQFRRITLPQVAPLVLIALLFRTIEAFQKSFDLVMGLTGGGPGEQTEVIAVISTGRLSRGSGKRAGPAHWPIWSSLL